MSYADKHRHQAECSEHSCPVPASKIMLIQGTPYWLCGEHYEERQRGKTA